MATRAENLSTSLDNIAAQLADMTANPKPTYSIDGKSVSWGEHFRNLQDAYEKLSALRQIADGPIEVRSRGYG